MDTLARPVERRIDDIEVLRAIAVLMVFVDNIPFNLFTWHSGLEDFLGGYWHGSGGIDIFLAISGFVIARSVLPSLRDAQTVPAFLAVTMRFLRRRFWRLQPEAALWLAVPLVLSVAFNRSGAFHSPRANVPSALTAMTGINNIRFAQIYGHGDPGVTFPYWLLSLQLQFTLLLPLLALLFRRHLAGVMLALVAFQFVMPFDPMFLFTRTGALASGVLLALWNGRPAQRMAEPVFLSRGPLVRGCFVGLVVVLIGALQSDLPRPLAAMPYAISAVLCAVLVHAASFDAGYIMRPGLMRKACVWLGTRSYAVYLTHVPAFALTRELYLRLRPPVYEHSFTLEIHYVIIALAITVCASELSYRYVEQPARRYGRSGAASVAA